VPQLDFAPWIFLVRTMDLGTIRMARTAANNRSINRCRLKLGPPGYRGRNRPKYETLVTLGNSQGNSQNRCKNSADVDVTTG